MVVHQHSAACDDDDAISFILAVGIFTILFSVPAAVAAATTTTMVQFWLNRAHQECLLNRVTRSDVAQRNAAAAKLVHKLNGGGTRHTA